MKTKTILSQSIKKVISKLLETTVLFHFYRFVVKYLNDSLIIKCLTFFSKNSSGSPEQSGFRPGDSCINQLLSINHETNSKCFRVSDLTNDLKSGFPLVDFFRTNGLFSSLIHRIRQ